MLELTLVLLGVDGTGVVTVTTGAADDDGGGERVLRLLMIPVNFLITSMFVL